MATKIPFKILKYILNLIIMCLIMSLSFYVIKDYLDLPIVYRSHSTQECIKVISPKNKYSCERMPRAYEVVWVQ